MIDIYKTPIKQEGSDRESDTFILSFLLTGREMFIVLEDLAKSSPSLLRGDLTQDAVLTAAPPVMHTLYY